MYIWLGHALEKKQKSMRNTPRAIARGVTHCDTLHVIPRGRSDRGNPYSTVVAFLENLVKTILFRWTDCHTSLRTGAQ